MLSQEERYCKNSIVYDVFAYCILCSMRTKNVFSLHICVIGPSLQLDIQTLYFLVANKKIIFISKTTYLSIFAAFTCDDHYIPSVSQVLLMSNIANVFTSIRVTICLSTTEASSPFEILS